MKCEMCKREFESTTIKCGEPYLHHDGKYYADCSWHGNHTCPHCGHDNAQVKMREEEADDDDSYMVTGLRNGYRTTLVRDLSYEEAKDLKTRLNRNNAYVNASIAPQGKFACNENTPIDDIIREWRMG